MFIDSSKKKIKDVKIVASELKTELLANLNHFNGITLSQFLLEILFQRHN